MEKTITETIQQEFVTKEGLAKVLGPPFTKRKIDLYRRCGAIPYVRIGPKTHLYHIPSVKQALIDKQVTEG